jgi:hypothetical protein
MKRSSGPRETISNLSESVRQQLNMYVIAAGAAGVSLLASVQPSEAKIVYTPADVVIGRNQAFAIDLNDDGTSDLVIKQRSHGIASFHHKSLLAEPAQGNGVEEGTQGHGWAAALKAGAKIGQTKYFAGSLEMAYQIRSIGHNKSGGYWNYSQARYLGVEFRINGRTHFGWARFKNSSYNRATLTGYAYETVAGKSIIAGKTKGPADERDEEDFRPSASLTSPIPDTPRPASLGMLALGAQGVPLWRRKESALEGD